MTTTNVETTTVWDAAGKEYTVPLSALDVSVPSVRRRRPVEAGTALAMVRCVLNHDYKGLLCLSHGLDGVQFESAMDVASAVARFFSGDEAVAANISQLIADFQAEQIEPAAAGHTFPLLDPSEEPWDVLGLLEQHP